LLVFQLGQPRIWMSMSRDGLLPRKFSKIHPKYGTPGFSTIVTGFLVGIPALVLDSDLVTDLTSIGTLFAFVLVAAGIIILRRIDPHRPRPFRTPWVPLVPLGAIGTCVYLMCELPKITWIRFFLWMLVGLAIYFCYGARNSRLKNRLESSTPPPKPV